MWLGQGNEVARTPPLVSDKGISFILPGWFKIIFIIIFLQDFYMYTIAIKAPWKRPYSKRDTELYREVN